MMGVSPPMTGEAGQTGTWRSRCPKVDPARCLTSRDQPRDCLLCWLYCPEACVEPGEPPVIDERYCKGCGICVNECPADAIEMRAEGSRDES
jgi:pyruvate ferredoxin oxidoreductase delta subunit